MWAAEARYPGDWSETTESDAQSALAEARSVYNSIVAEFRKRGVLAG